MNDVDTDQRRLMMAMSRNGLEIMLCVGWEENGVVPYLSLDAGDGAELAELLRFLGGWLGTAEDDVAASLARFVGTGGYDVAQLRGDLDRFTFLLGGDDGEPLFGPETG